MTESNYDAFVAGRAAIVPGPGLTYSWRVPPVLPAGNAPVIAAYRTALGEWRRVLAGYYRQFELEMVMHELEMVMRDDADSVPARSYPLAEDCEEDGHGNVWSRAGWYELTAESGYAERIERPVEMWTDIPALPDDKP